MNSTSASDTPKVDPAFSDFASTLLKMSSSSKGSSPSFLNVIEPVPADEKISESHLHPRVFPVRTQRILGHDVFQLDLNLPSGWCLG
uniref:Uncharacterized protein n=1 Tax=Steinernema glaseri TaxID=37863 RepID=A0A1I7ZRY4_9BILA